MKFCPTCGSMMTKITPPTGNIIFKCNCQETVEGNNDDTLMAEEYIESSSIASKHEVFIKNSPFDPAGLTVLEKCPKCHLDFMTMIIPGSDQVTMYTCVCGYEATRDEYVKTVEKTQTKNPIKEQ